LLQIEDDKAVVRAGARGLGPIGDVNLAITHWGQCGGAIRLRRRDVVGFKDIQIVVDQREGDTVAVALLDDVFVSNSRFDNSRVLRDGAGIVEGQRFYNLTSRTSGTRRRVIDKIDVVAAASSISSVDNGNHAAAGGIDPLRSDECDRIHFGGGRPPRRDRPRVGIDQTELQVCEAGIRIPHLDEFAEIVPIPAKIGEDVGLIVGETEPGAGSDDNGASIGIDQERAGDLPASRGAIDFEQLLVQKIILGKIGDFCRDVVGKCFRNRSDRDRIDLRDDRHCT
jgi:hypothetical protein